MGRRKVTLEGFGEAVAEIIADYADGVYATQSKAVTYSTNQALRQVKANSGQFNGEYSGGWRKKIDRGETSSTGVVYNVRPGLPHLLEKGHATVNGGRTAARPHALPVQTEVNKVLLDKLEEGLNDL